MSFDRYRNPSWQKCIYQKIWKLKQIQRFWNRNYYLKYKPTVVIGDLLLMSENGSNYVVGISSSPKTSDLNNHTDRNFTHLTQISLHIDLENSKKEYYCLNCYVVVSMKCKIAFCKGIMKFFILNIYANHDHKNQKILADSIGGQLIQSKGN